MKISKLAGVSTGLFAGVAMSFSAYASSDTDSNKYSPEYTRPLQNMKRDAELGSGSTYVKPHPRVTVEPLLQNIGIGSGYAETNPHSGVKAPDYRRKPADPLPPVRPETEGTETNPHSGVKAPDYRRKPEEESGILVLPAGAEVAPFGYVPPTANIIVTVTRGIPEYYGIEELEGFSTVWPKLQNIEKYYGTGSGVTLSDFETDIRRAKSVLKFHQGSSVLENEEKTRLIQNIKTGINRIKNSVVGAGITPCSKYKDNYDSYIFCISGMDLSLDKQIFIKGLNEVEADANRALDSLKEIEYDKKMEELRRQEVLLESKHKELVDAFNSEKTRLEEDIQAFEEKQKKFDENENQTERTRSELLKEAEKIQKAKTDLQVQAKELREELSLQKAELIKKFEAMENKEKTIEAASASGFGETQTPYGTAYGYGAAFDLEKFQKKADISKSVMTALSGIHFYFAPEDKIAVAVSGGVFNNQYSVGAGFAWRPVSNFVLNSSGAISRDKSQYAANIGMSISF